MKKTTKILIFIMTIGGLIAIIMTALKRKEKQQRMEKREVSKLSTSNKAVKFIKAHEGLRTRAYDDAQPHEKIDSITQVKGFLTIGYGHTANVEVGQVITETEAENMLVKDLVRFERIVQNKVNVKLNQNQFDALVSHTFNTGGSNSLFDLVNGTKTVVYGGKSFDLAAWWTEKYITSKGVQMSGLVRRRKEELELYNA